MNIYESTKWGVFAAGPGNVFAAHSFEEAVEKASEMNKLIVDYIKPISGSSHYPLLFAQVDRWENIASFEHNPYETDWNDPFA